MNRRQLMFNAILVFSFLLCAQLLVGSVFAQPPQDRNWKRPLPVKPTNASLTENHVPGLVRLKLIDEYPAAVFDGRIQSLNPVAAPPYLAELQSILRGAAIEQKIPVDRARLREWRETAMRNLGQETADLSQWYIVRVSLQSDIATLIDQLNALDIVEIALPVLKAPAPPSYCQTNPCVSEQGYLYSPPGINAQAAWTQGITGQNVRVALLEYAFGYHNDVPNPIVLNTSENLGTNSTHNDASHGNATYGIMAGKNNSFGVTGIAHGSTFYFGSTLSWYSQGGYFYQDICPILTQARSALQTGDVIVINNQFTDWVGSGLVPVEWDPEFYQCVKTTVGNNFNVIISAGNGASNLDSSYFNSGHKPFLAANNSGSIIAGGGMSTDLSRWGSSTYGSRVNVQGWAQSVRTTTSSPQDDYMWFGGTSSATPIVGAAVALVQSAYKSATGQAATPSQIRTALMATGSPQTGDTSKHVGPLPNVTAAIQYLIGGGAGPTSPQNFSVQSWFCYGQGYAEWQAPSGGGSFTYELQASYYNYFPPSQSWLEYVGTGTSKFLNVSQTTYFRVRACSSGNCSSWTNPQSLTPLSGCY